MAVLEESRLLKKVVFALVAFIFCQIFLVPSFSSGATMGENGLASEREPLEGKHLYKHYCAVCHGISGKGNGVNAPNLDPHPSDLTGSEVASLSDQEIYEVIEKGGAAVDLSAAMPPWGKTFSKNQIASLVVYVRSLSKKSSAAVETVRFSDLKREENADCSICHVKFKGEPIAPNLGHEGSKLHRKWLYQFLKEPTKVRPVGFIPLTKARMPNFYFSDDEAAAVTEFLMAQKDKGISEKEMNGVGLSRLSNPSEIEKGRVLFVDKYACDACHQTGGQGGGIVGPNLSEVAGRLRPEWMFFWLKNPQAIRSDSPMPNFGISDSEIVSLSAYILSLGKEAPKEEPLLISVNEALYKKGEKLVKEKNCVYCHTLNSFNSQLRKVER